MAQEATPLTTGSIRNAETADGTLVRPQENVTVYATDKVGVIVKAGEPMEVHSALAEKLVASGKAVREEPKGKKA